MSKKTETEDRYQPVAFDPKAYAVEKRRIDPAFRNAYDALEGEFAALAARKDVDQTPSDVEAAQALTSRALAFR
jgi:hypothetical protein